MGDDPQVIWHQHNVSRENREESFGHHGCVVWFTGMSGSGKSTIANLVERSLFQRNVHSCLLDGDNVRHGLNAGPNILAERHSEAFAKRFGLGFAPEDREENIRRVGEVALLFASFGMVTLAAFVSPYRKDRDAVRQRVNEQRDGDFVEVYVNAPLEVCESRDPKGLYKQAREGKIRGFTGIDAPYEEPLSPEITLNAATGTPDLLAAEVVSRLEALGKIKPV